MSNLDGIYPDWQAVLLAFRSASEQASVTCDTPVSLKLTSGRVFLPLLSVWNDSTRGADKLVGKVIVELSGSDLLLFFSRRCIY